MRATMILLLSALGACGTLGGTTTTSSGPQTTPATTQTTPAVTPTLGCPKNVDFVDEGRVMRADQPESDTAIVGLITWETSEGCEVFRIDFETVEGAPATTPPSVTVEFLESRQIVRIRTSAELTVITDQIVETELVDRLFVVRGLEGGMFVDVHLKLPSQARARLSNSPARLILDLQRSLSEFSGEAAVSANVVLTSPWEGAQLATNVEVGGYARTTGDQVLMIATSGNELQAEALTNSAISNDAWGEFRTRIEVPVGETTLFVGERDAGDGSLVGVTVEVTNR